MGGCPPWAYSRCHFYLPSAGGVLGYFVPVRPDVAHVRKSVALSWSHPQRGTHRFGKPSYECRVPLTPLCYVTQGIGLCQTKYARRIALHIRLRIS